VHCCTVLGTYMTLFIATANAKEKTNAAI